MMTYRMLCVTVLVVAGTLVVPSIRARSVDGLSRMEQLLASMASSPSSEISSAPASAPSSPSSSTALGFLTGDHSFNKRYGYDSSCRGLYDRGIFRKLERLCDDCYNLYRKPSVGKSCRANCYGNMVFRQCLEDLLMTHVLDEYASDIRTVGK